MDGQDGGGRRPRCWGGSPARGTARPGSDLQTLSGADTTRVPTPRAVPCPPAPAEAQLRRRSSGLWQGTSCQCEGTGGRPSPSGAGPSKMTRPGQGHTQRHAQGRGLGGTSPGTPGLGPQPPGQRDEESRSWVRRPRQLDTPGNRPVGTRARYPACGCERELGKLPQT